MRDRRDFGVIIVQCTLASWLLTPSLIQAQVDTAWTRVRMFPFMDGFYVAELAFGPNGSIYQAGEPWCCGDGHGWAALRYNTEGAELWAGVPGMSSICCGAVSLAVDRDGNAYTAGDINAAVKFSPTGELLWIRRVGDWPVAARSESQATASGFGSIAVDDSGNAYMLTSDFTTIKYTPSGDSVWTRRIISPAGLAEGLAISVSGRGDVWSTGTIMAAWPYTDMVTVHYTTEGDSLWAFIYAGLGGESDRAHAQVLTRDGGLYLAGGWSAVSSSPLPGVIKLTSTGDTAWTKLFADSSGAHGFAADIGIDSSGKVLVIGRYGDGPGPHVWRTLKLTALGQELWARDAEIPDLSYPSALTIDRHGTVYVTGHVDLAHGPATYAYSAEGELLWAHEAEGNDILVDDSGYVYLAGTTYLGSGPTFTKLSQIDSDSDLTIDLYDNCLLVPNTSQTNGDDDSLGDACDVCPQVTNPDQALTIALTGDIDESGSRTSADIILLVNFVFKGGAPPVPCVAAGDVNCSGAITSSDIVLMVNHVFKAGLTPCDVCIMDDHTWSCP